MATLAELQEQLVALKEARSSGVLQISHGGTYTQFRSISELSAAIAAVESEIRKLDSTPRKVRYVRQTGRG